MMTDKMISHAKVIAINHSNNKSNKIFYVVLVEKPKVSCRSEIINSNSNNIAPSAQIKSQNS